MYRLRRVQVTTSCCMLLLCLTLTPMMSCDAFVSPSVHRIPKLTNNKLHQSKFSIRSAASSSRSSSEPINNDDQSQRRLRDRLTTLLSGPDAERPNWAPTWMPTWILTMRPTMQLVTVLLFYIFHLSVLVQRSIHFPIQLVPNERGFFQSVGLDSIAGMVSLVMYQYIRKLMENDGPTAKEKAIPPLTTAPATKQSPWKQIFKSEYSRFSSFLAMCSLFQAYFWTGRLSLWWEDAFYYLANFYPITVPMHRSLCVLFGHLTWIVMGATILRVLPRPQNFFDNTWYQQHFSSTEITHDGAKKTTKTRQWVWWTIGGYFVSSWFFNIADFCNQWILPVSILEQAQDSVVSQLINPEMNDRLASLIGYIAPCITAPWWEEVLYRGFLLPALILNMKYKWAILWSGVIFSIHHMSPTASIPLAVLGWTWGILYTKSGNLLTTILVHAMWNSRIFLGSWLGI